jgi:outer membrane lipoprotein SlyB
MRKTLLLIGVLGLSCLSWAKTDPTSWANLSVLRPGQRIQLVDMQSKKHSGTFTSFSDTTITYHEAAGEQTIQKQDIRSVKLMGITRRLENTLIGAGVGSGVGAGIGAATWENHGWVRGKGTGAAVCAGIGLIFGTVIGVLMPGHKEIYSANSH